MYNNHALLEKIFIKKIPSIFVSISDIELRIFMCDFLTYKQLL